MHLTSRLSTHTVGCDTITGIGYFIDPSNVSVCMGMIVEYGTIPTTVEHWPDVNPIGIRRTLEAREFDLAAFQAAYRTAIQPHVPRISKLRSLAELADDETKLRELCGPRLPIALTTPVVPHRDSDAPLCF